MAKDESSKKPKRNISLPSEQVVHELIHYLKTGEKAVSNDILKYIEIADDLCPFKHGETTDFNCYVCNEGIQLLLKYLKKYYLCFEFFGIYPYDRENLNKKIMDLERPQCNINAKQFKDNLAEIHSIIKENEEYFNTKKRRLTCEESIRLDEAVNTFSNNCFFSSVVMAVSAVEARLHYLIKKKNKTIYKKHFEDATLGRIIQLFDEEQYKDKKFNSIKKVLPRKYKSLMEVLNYYRVFSAHPKTVDIKRNEAQAILNLTFSLLFDEETKIEDKKLLKCK